MNLRLQFFIFGFLFFVGGISCIENVVSENEKQKTKNVDTLIQEENAILKSDTIPWIFEKLIAHMDSLGYDPDTTYFDESMYLEEPFHYANYETYFIHELLVDESKYGDLIHGTPYSRKVDSIFSLVTNIRLYPWRMPNTTEGRMRSGVVEEWYFENQENAKYVLEFLEREQNYLGFPFIKTQAYYFQCAYWLFIFHSPDSGVAYRHQQFYEWIKKECYRNGL